MPEVVVPARTVIVRYRCDFCDQAEVEPTGDMLTMNPPLYPHVCPRCKAPINLPRMYPRTEVIEETPDGP